MGSHQRNICIVSYDPGGPSNRKEVVAVRNIFIYVNNNDIRHSVARLQVQPILLKICTYADRLPFTL